MSTTDATPDVPAGPDWWLCSHLITLSTPTSSADEHSALLEEISSHGMRLAFDERVPEGTTLQIRCGSLEIQTTVVDCRVRTDDFCVEVRFAKDFQWTPDIWAPDHLYRPAARRSKAAGTS